ncbi:carboxylesterase/lipase family protein [Altericroceibacterium indicum]|nr:carboxylesterase family protein [Altericroceibacterium indicum]
MMKAKITQAMLAITAAFFAQSAMAQTVSIDTGQVEGVTQDGISSWKGIPYAAPPEGAWRWRAPQPVTPWKGVRKADSFAHDCMQIPFAQDAAPLGTPPAEDCLYVNVWRPEGTTASDRLPVMFWIYGGGLVNGGASPAVYDGSELARQGVILVSFNYRLGRFGFFAHPSLTAANEDNGLLGNYGFLDQIAALRWVQKNIQSFGGDPNNVTIFGESAGGRSINMLMTSPMARGMFAKAIVMSGSGRTTEPLLPIHADYGPDAEDDGVGFAKWAGISGEGPEALEELRALPADKLAAGVGLGQAPVAPSSGPMIDGMAVTAPSDEIYAAGDAAAVPFMAGANTADLGFGLSADGDVVAQHFGDLAAEARIAYRDFAKQPQQLAAAISSDQRMVEPARFMVQQMALSGEPAWYYRAGYVPSAMRPQWTGLPHATEIPLFFQTLDARYPGAVTPQDRAAAANMSAYFVNFARSGNPNGKGLAQWPVYDDATRPVMLMGMDGQKGGADPWRARLDVTQKRAEAQD